MCTLVILRRPEHDWPVVIGANRDEMTDRPALPPGRHWPDRAEVVAGLDIDGDELTVGRLVHVVEVCAAVEQIRAARSPTAQGVQAEGQAQGRVPIRWRPLPDSHAP